ncbi:MAG: hypothetical protein COT84_01950 [Chlamydiae bacterium CG10_big_fil_rev_8_21_14_0_10_35_9]|nr:MAG: hypothetical protein COT84_01950 [Chlamydiae bacterium CG10_big_fil_rev_8_21_14_0_10_35_9]
MSKRNTILIAVMVNFGLLTLLFFTATRQKEEKLPVNPSEFLVENEVPIMENDYFEQNDLKEMTISEKEPTIVHKLPEMEPVALEPKKQEPKKPEVIKKEVDKKLITVTVKKGDSLDKIAKTYRVSVNEIIEENQLKTTIIRIGQVLKIPEAQKKTTEPQKTTFNQSEYYVVKPGDNPWTIAMKHHIKLEELLRINNLDKTKAKKLKPGDRLKIR